MNVLIFMKESDLKPAGGPAGFCFNIFHEVKEQGIEEIKFLPSEDPVQMKRVDLYRKITNSLPRWLNAAQIAYRRKKNYQKMIVSPQLHGIDFNLYDAVHFHSTISLYKYRKDLEGYRGKILLTTHSPVPQFQEIYAELPTKIEKKLYRSFYSTLDQIDEYAFARADYVLFPCEDAEESYLKNWYKYGEIHNQLCIDGKIKYIPTGILPKKILRDRKQVCEELSLNPESFISYAGRHNQVKGYDLLQNIAQKLWRSGNDFPFVICGKESPIHGLNDSRWREVGWTTDSQSYIAASDVFVLPNRETYFDIIMLEVLSCGKIVVASRTGGNKYFEKIDAQGIFLYDTADEAVDIIKRISLMSKKERQMLEYGNRKLFCDCFTTDKYIKEYLKFLSLIV